MRLSQATVFKRSLSFRARGEALAKELLLGNYPLTSRMPCVLLVQGCSNKEIASQLNISPRTVKQHLRTLFLRAGIKDGRKRVKLATAIFQKEQVESCNQGNV
jgi:DNA-binding NarL/FixJ family response regulator